MVRAWSAALRADDNERAASLFARNAAIVQAGTLTRLPCAGTVVSLKRNGSATATATFRLDDRGHRSCGDPPGAEAIAVFVVEHGKIVLWAQIGSQVALSH